LLPGTKDGRVSEGAVEPTLGDVAVGSLGEVDAVPAPVVGWVLAGVSPRLAALGRQVEVVLAHAGSTTTRTRRLPQEPCAGNIRKIIRSCAHQPPAHFSVYKKLYYNHKG
jgi:hypothetical protein